MQKITPHATQVEWMYANVPNEELLQMVIEDEVFNGRTVKVKGQTLLNFGNGSYLGLHADDRLKVGAMIALSRFGVQFPSSRSYLSIPLYQELEGLLSQIFDHPTLAAPTTTLAHMSVMPVLMTSSDAVVIDQKAHASLQTMIRIVQAGGTTVEVIRHNRMDELESMILKLREKHERIWFVTDGVFSMYGDVAPFDELKTLLHRYDQLRLYIDDAHGMSWTGKNGRGLAFENLELSERSVYVTSLNKGFAAGGGAIVVPNEKIKRTILRAGPGMVFSGPLHPAELGAAIESAKIHLSPEITERQNKVKRNIEQFLTTARELDLPLADEYPTPIFFFALSKMPVVAKACIEMRKAGFWVNPAVFPAVPVKNSGIRISLTWHHSPEEVTSMLKKLHQILPDILAEEKWTLHDARRVFQLQPIHVLA